MAVPRILEAAPPVRIAIPSLLGATAPVRIPAPSQVDWAPSFAIAIPSVPWRRSSAWVSATFPKILMFSAAEPVIELVQPGARAAADRFAYDEQDAVGLLANAMRALHAKLPLTEVVLTTRE